MSTTGASRLSGSSGERRKGRRYVCHRTVTARVGRNVFLACTFKIDQIHFILNQLKIPEYVSGLSHECMHWTFIG